MTRWQESSAVGFLMPVVGFLMLAACGRGLDPSGSARSGGSLPEFNGTTFACGNGEADPARCLDIVREYAAAIPDALACDPGASEACTAPRPVTVSQQTEAGPSLSQGLCNCAFMVNPTRSAALDAALARFAAEGCHIGCCPCPPGGPVAHACMAASPARGTCG